MAEPKQIEKTQNYEELCTVWDFVQFFYVHSQFCYIIKKKKKNHFVSKIERVVVNSQKLLTRN